MTDLRTSLLRALIGATLVSVSACSAGTSAPTPAVVAPTASSTASPPSSPTTTSTSPASPSSPSPAGSAAPPTSPTASTPRVTESNPPGDIPDNQAYVAYRPPGGALSVKVPEGWARTDAGSGTITFTDKLNRIEVAVSSAARLPTPATVESVDVPKLQNTTASFAMGKVTSVRRSGAPAVLLTFQQDSNPDPVTGKVVRDAVERYTFVRAGSRLDLSLIGPVNADNVDPWRIVSESVAWSR